MKRKKAWSKKGWSKNTEELMQKVDVSINELVARGVDIQNMPEDQLDKIIGYLFRHDGRLPDAE